MKPLSATYTGPDSKASNWLENIIKLLKDGYLLVHTELKRDGKNVQTKEWIKRTFLLVCHMCWDIFTAGFHSWTKLFTLGMKWSPVWKTDPSIPSSFLPMLTHVKVHHVRTSVSNIWRLKIKIIKRMPRAVLCCWGICCSYHANHANLVC